MKNKPENYTIDLVGGENISINLGEEYIEPGYTAVDEKGNIIDGDKIMAVCGADMKAQGTLTGLTMLARRGGPLADGALAGEALFALEEELGAFSAAKLTCRSCISCHYSLPPVFNYTRLRLGGRQPL